MQTRRMKLSLMILAMTFWTGLAGAGPLMVHDSTGTLSRGDVSKLTNAASDYPFETRVVMGVYPGRDGLEESARSAVGRDTVVVAVDPTHKHVAVRFGAGTGVKMGDFDSIAHAGNQQFAAGDWEGGIEAICLRAQASASTSTGIAMATEPVVIHQGLGFWGWLGILVVIGALLWVIVRLFRKFTAVIDENRLETAELRSRNVRELLSEDAARPSYRSTHAPRDLGTTPVSVNAVRPVYNTTGAASYAAPSQVIVNQPPSNDGMLTGMLIGEAMADRGRDREVIVERDREVVREDRGSRDADAGGSSSDFGGGSSSFDSDSGSSNSNDSGGSDSSFDSGGSSDSSDLGSGGSDFGGGDSGGGGSSDF